jgi:hypothetical protein
LSKFASRAAVIRIAKDKDDRLSQWVTRLAARSHPNVAAAALANAAILVLRPNGHVGVVFWHPIPREQTPILGQPRGPATELRMSVEHTRAAVESAGLKLETVVELLPYHYGAIFIRQDAVA